MGGPAPQGPQALHAKARSAHPAYPARAEIADADVHWQGSVEYHPVEFTHAVVYANDVTVKPEGWADPGAARASPPCPALGSGPSPHMPHRPSFLATPERPCLGP